MEISEQKKTKPLPKGTKHKDFNISINLIKNVIPRVSNCLFKLFEAELFKQEGDEKDQLKKDKNVYLLQLHLFNFDFADQILSNLYPDNNVSHHYSNLSVTNINDKFEHMCLKRLGYVLIKEELICYFVYEK